MTTGGNREWLHTREHAPVHESAAVLSERLAAQERLFRALGPAATIKTFACAFVEEARALFGASHACVSSFEQGGARLIALQSDAMTEAYALAGLLEEPAPVSREVRLVGDLAREHRSGLEEQALHAGLRSLLQAPCLAGCEPVGTIILGSRASEAWSKEDAERLAAYAAAFGLVTERGRLRAAEEEAEEVAGNRPVGHLGRALSNLRDAAQPEQIGSLFAGEVRRFFGADVVLIHSWVPESGVRNLVAVDAKDNVSMGQLRKPLKDSASFHGMRDQAAAIYDKRQPSGAPDWLREMAESAGMGSAIVVRLDTESSSVGLIAAGAEAYGQLGPAELEVLREVARPLAVVLERANVVTSLRQHAQRSQAVIDILSALGPQETIEEVATPLANALRTMYEADHSCIVLLEGHEKILAGIDSSLVPEWRTGKRLPRSEVFERVGAAGYQLVSDSTRDDARSSDVLRLLNERGERSAMRARIGTAAQPLGMVALGSRQAGNFTEADARQLAAIVQPLAVAVSSFQERRELEQRSMRLEFTNRILTRLSAGGTPEHLAAGFLEECHSLFNCGHAIAITFDEDAHSGTLLAVDSEVLGTGALPRAVRLEEIQSAQMIERPLPQLVVDAREEAQGIHHRELIAAGLYSVIRAPLIVQERVRGAVALWGSGAGLYSSEDAELLGTLARPLAIALEKAAALASLGESELKYRSLVAQAEEMIFLFDSGSRALLDANTHTARALGYEQQELMRLRLDDIVEAPEDEIVAQVQRTIDDGELHLADRRYRRRDGSLIDADDVASLVSYGGRQAVLVLARDVSERKTLQRQLIQSQKMESLGGMAGNVAHDFNNLLTTIMGFTGLLKRSANLDSEERENLGLIEDAARRAADLTGRLLAFARGGLVRFGPVDLRNVVNDTLRLAEPGLHQGLEISTRLPGSPITVEGDAGQLEQALLNILLNARDAMPDGGSIAIDLRADGLMATITIRDTGPGMDDETKTRIFEPFFTTKPLGSGTGLGMAITYGIVQGHHGNIAVESRPGAGTNFTITLPLLPLTLDAGAIDFNAGEGNLVLVVDDDEMVRRATSATLAELGFNVVEAPGGATAIEIVRARPDRFSVVLLDLVMPGMTGSETFRALTAIRPDLPVVVCTGYAADAHIDSDVKRRIAGLVQKPFTAERLARALDAAGAKPTRGPLP